MRPWHPLRRSAGPALALVLTACGLGAAETAAPPAGTATLTRQQQADQRLAELRAEHSIPGLTAAVAIGGELIWSGADGWADAEAQKPISPATQLRLASVSKVVTVALVAKLVEAGKLDLDRPVRHYLPSYPGPGGEATPRQLSAHLGGIRHYIPRDAKPEIDEQHFPTVTASLAIFQADPLVAPPGTRFNYTTFGYTLLAAVLEVACGEPFLDCLERHVVTPLGVPSLVADRLNAELPARSRFYNRGLLGRATLAPPLDPSYKWAGGGLVATAPDLVRLGSAFLRPGFFQAETLTTIFTPQATADGKSVDVGIGWRIRRDEELATLVYHHGGNQSGSRAALVLLPEHRLAVALLSNLGGVPQEVEAAALSLARVFLPPPTPPAPAPGE